LIATAICCYFSVQEDKLLYIFQQSAIKDERNIRGGIFPTEGLNFSFVDFQTDDVINLAQSVFCWIS
jgi:hypothetical protein